MSARVPRFRASKLVALLLAAAAGVAMPRLAAAQGAIAVIVHRSNPMETITAGDLRRLFLGTSTVLSNKERVVLYEQADLREPFYRTVLQMNGDRVKRHWIGVVFTGLGASPPKTVPEAIQLRDLVARQPGAIGFVNAREVDATVKVLAVDGLRPGEAGYPLRASSPAPGR